MAQKRGGGKGRIADCRLRIADCGLRISAVAEVMADKAECGDGRTCRGASVRGRSNNLTRGASLKSCRMKWEIKMSPTVK
jgi:hypothetical protein